MARPTFNELRAFIAIAARGSFRAAAVELDLTPSSLSHLMRGLERNLGVRLLNRTTRSVSLTEAGERLLERLSPALRDVDEALGEIDPYRAGLKGTVRINTPEVGARILLLQVVPTFLERHPGCDVDIFVENSPVDIVAKRFDAGVRMGYSVQQDMIAVPFDGAARFMPFASPGYVADRGLPEHPRDLVNHACIRNRLPGGRLYHWEFEKHGERLSIDVKGVLTLNHMSLMIEAAVAGMGVIYTLERAARPFVDAGQLVPMLSDWSPSVEGLTLYYPGFRQVPSCLRNFIDVMREVLA